MASFADLLLTCDVPAVDLSGTSWDGTDDGERSKSPHYLRSPDDAAGVTWPAPRPPGHYPTLLYELQRRDNVSRIQVPAAGAICPVTCRNAICRLKWWLARPPV